MQEEDSEVLIVGAGPTGLTLACDLMRRGVQVRVIERRAGPQLGSRGKGLQPRTLELFEDLGVLGQILAQGSAYPRLRVHFGPLSFPWKMMAEEAATANVPYPNAWMVPQTSTEAVLRERLAQLGGHIEFDNALVDFEQESDCVRAHLNDSQGGARTLRARYLVGADGGRSTVRKALGLSFLGESYERKAMLVGDLQAEGLSRDAWHVFRPTGRALALCPLPDGQSFQLFAQIQGAPPDATPDLAMAQQLMNAAAGARAPRLHSPSWLSVYRPNVRMVDSYRVRRVLLAGDAAHVHPPTGGQGLNTGVQDAYNLGWKLAAVLSGAPQGLLDTYQEERLPVAAGVLQISRKLYQSSLHKQRRGEDVKQLKIHYRHSSLSEQQLSQTGRLQAGDRAPDVAGLGVRGDQRLFELTRGPHWTALSFGPRVVTSAAALETGLGRNVHAFAVTTGAEASGLHLCDARGLLRSTYGAAVTQVVIRPDGYIGFLSDAADALFATQLYLARVGANAVV